jgi:hypothetical protein
LNPQHLTFVNLVSVLYNAEYLTTHGIVS